MVIFKHLDIYFYITRATQFIIFDMFTTRRESILSKFLKLILPNVIDTYVFWGGKTAIYGQNSLTTIYVILLYFGSLERGFYYEKNIWKLSKIFIYHNKKALVIFFIIFFHILDRFWSSKYPKPPVRLFT